MTTKLAEARKSRALRWLIAAGAALLIAVVAIAIDMRSSASDRVAGPAVPNLLAQINEAQKISIISRDATYRISRTQRGWAMTDRGDFPVRADRLHQLTSGLVNLQRVRRMTSDPARHERLGVGDPAQGGNGVLVQIENANGAYLVNLILGVERQGLYMRTPGDDQVWAVRGELPPLRQAAAWLDLQPVSFPDDRIARVEIAPAQGPAYTLTRSATGAFALSPASAQASPTTLLQTARRITELQPVDVLPASAVQGAAMARVRAHLSDGALIDAEVVQFQDRPWLKLIARAERPDAQETVNAVNARASGWAYGLSQTDYETLAPTLATLAPPAN